MASISFNKLKNRTKVDDGESLSNKNSMRELLNNSLIMQNSISDQYRKVQRQYNRNKGLYNLLLKEVLDIKKQKNRPKYDKIKNPLGGAGKGKGGGLFGGLLSSLLGAGLSGLLLAPFMSKIKKGLSTLTKGIKNSIGKMFSSATKAGKNSISRISSVLKSESVKKLGSKLNLDKIKNSQIAKGIKGLGKKGLNKAIARGTQLGLGKGIGRVAIKQVTRMIGAGVIGAAAGTIGMPLLIASAAAGVGYGSYKIGRYLKLSEKLDGFIKKVSNGKYTNIVDLILGLVDGSVGKELYTHVKEKVNTLFDNTVIDLKNKVNEVLGEFSPFNDTTDEPDTNKSDGGNQSTDSSNVSGGTSFSSILKGASNSAASTYDKLQGIGSGVLQTGSSMLQGTQSDSSTSSGSVSPNSDSSNVNSGDLAWHAITKGKNTEITSGYGPRWGTEHTGIDIRAKVGTPIYAPEAGFVSSNTHKTGGIQAFVTAKSGTKYGFAHLSKVDRAGPVKKGDLIAYSGNTGKSTGPHIHLSIRQPGGKRVDPQTYKLPDVKVPYAQKGTGEMGDFTDIKSNYSTENVKTINYNSFLNSDSNNTKSNENTLQASVPRTTTMQQPKQSKGTKAGSISGGLKDTKDPRGALSSTILSASTSPLFI